MGCCIAIAFVISLVRKGWFAVFPSRRPEPELFAPPAYRPAPGGLGPVAGVSAARLPAGGPRPIAATAQAGRLAPMFLGAFALTGMLYMATVFALTRFDLASTGSATVGWSARNVVLAALILTALVGAAATYDGAGISRASFGVVLLGAGFAWVGLGVLDMHGFSLLNLAHDDAGCACACCGTTHGSLLADTVFHGVGLVAVLAGAAQLAKQRRAPVAA